MREVRNLADVSLEEQRTFVKSFDTVLSDLDGVIWQNFVPIPGSERCMKTLKKMGKNIHYVSNNGTASGQYIFMALLNGKFDLVANDLVVPSHIMTNYLKKLNITKDIFVVGMHPMKDELIKNGFSLVPDNVITVEENTDAVLIHNDENCNVGAVIMDNDFNINYMKLQKAMWYLKNPECLFLVTHRDISAPFGPKGPIIGNYYFIELLKELTGKDYVMVGKPSEICVQYLTEKFKITHPNKVLFIGDSIQSDMHIAALGGFQKLLVLSGHEKLENVKNWQYPEELKPDYYVQDLGTFLEVRANTMQSTFIGCAGGQFTCPLVMIYDDFRHVPAHCPRGLLIVLANRIH